MSRPASLCIKLRASDSVICESRWTSLVQCAQNIDRSCALTALRSRVIGQGLVISICLAVTLMWALNERGESFLTASKGLTVQHGEGFALMRREHHARQPLLLPRAKSTEVVDGVGIHDHRQVGVLFG